MINPFFIFQRVSLAQEFINFLSMNASSYLALELVKLAWMLCRRGPPGTQTGPIRDKVPEVSGCSRKSQLLESNFVFIHRWSGCSLVLSIFSRAIPNSEIDSKYEKKLRTTLTRKSLERVVLSSGWCTGLFPLLFILVLPFVKLMLLL